MIRVYIEFDPTQGYPAGRAVTYECLVCAGTVPSMPSHDDPFECRCRNVIVDGDAGRVSVKDNAQLRAFRTTS